MPQTDFHKYFQSEKERLEANYQEKLANYRKFFNPRVGETKMLVHYAKPRTIETKYGTRKVFEISVDEDDYDFTVNEKSPLYRDLIQRLAQAKEAIDIILVRTGTGKSTRYSIKEA
jgi:hypothetical protein